MVEFALSVALIALIAIPSVKTLGNQVEPSFWHAKEEIAGAGSFPGVCPPSDLDCAE